MPEIDWRYSLGGDGTDVDGDDGGGDDDPRTCGLVFHFEVELSERLLAVLVAAATAVLMLVWLRR